MLHEDSKKLKNYRCKRPDRCLARTMIIAACKLWRKSGNTRCNSSSRSSISKHPREMLLPSHQLARDTNRNSHHSKWMLLSNCHHLNSNSSRTTSVRAKQRSTVGSSNFRSKKHRTSVKNKRRNNTNTTNRTSKTWQTTSSSPQFTPTVVASPTSPRRQNKSLNPR